MSRPRTRLLRPAAAAFGLCVLLGGLTLPLLGLVLAGEPAPFCCSRGRCCCADETAGTDDRTCLRRGCGCRHPDATLAGAPLRIEAVLPVADPVVTIPPSEARWEAACERLLPRADAPPVPPPRRLLPA